MTARIMKSCCFDRPINSATFILILFRGHHAKLAEKTRVF
jgi:hypothetical protein